MHLTSSLSTLFVLLMLLSFPCTAANEPARQKPVKEGEVTLFNDVIAPINAEDEPGVAKETIEETYKRGRMAFLFGQYDTAYKIWQPLAAQGFAKAQATLGWMYHIGKGAKRSYRTAYSWYEKAADQNHPIALNNMGVFHEQGLSVSKSMKLAFKWYKESAEWGYSYGQYNLGILYKTGKGVKKDTNKAIYWLELATLQGVKQAQDALESMSASSKASHRGIQVMTDESPDRIRRQSSKHRRSKDTNADSSDKKKSNWHSKDGSAK